MAQLPSRREREHDPVRAEAFGKATPEQVKDLHDDPDGWLAELRLGITGIQSRLMVRSIEEKERVGALKVKAHLESRMPYVKNLVVEKKHRDEAIAKEAIARGDSQDPAVLRDAVEVLRNAIAFHHATVTKDEATEDEQADADEALWATIGIIYAASVEDEKDA